MLASQIHCDHDAADRVLASSFDRLRRTVESIIDQRDRAFRALAYEGNGVQRLTRHAQESGLPFTAAFDSTSGCWKVTYGLGYHQHVGLGLTVDEAARAAYDTAAASPVSM